MLVTSHTEDGWVCCVMTSEHHCSVCYSCGQLSMPLLPVICDEVVPPACCPGPSEEGCREGSSSGETALKAENRQKAHKPQQSTELSYTYLQRMNSKVSLLTDLTYFMFIFFSLRYYPVFTFHFPSTLMSYHLPTPPSKSEMPASNMTASDHLSSSFKYLT